jgi:hypothetical protein
MDAEFTLYKVPLLPGAFSEPPPPIPLSPSPWVMVGEHPFQPSKRLRGTGACVLKPSLPISVFNPVPPSLGLTILEVACNMELPHGGEGWQQLRQGYLPPEFTAGE